MAIQAKRCKKCNGLMEQRLGSWECHSCGFRETTPSDSPSNKKRRGVRSPPKSESPGISSAAEWKKEHGTHMLDFSKGSGRNPQHVDKPPPRHQPEYQKIQEFTKREQSDTKYFLEPGSDEAKHREEENRLAVEKNIFFGLWLLLCGYCAYSLIVIMSQGLFSIDLQWHEVAYISVFCVAVMIGIMWYTLYCDSPELKWIFVILGSITALGQTIFFFIVFTNQTIMDNLTFNLEYTGVVGLLSAAVLAVGWTGWYVYILYRDVKGLQA